MEYIVSPRRTVYLRGVVSAPEAGALVTRGTTVGTPLTVGEDNDDDDEDDEEEDDDDDEDEDEEEEESDDE